MRRSRSRTLLGLGFDQPEHLADLFRWRCSTLHASGLVVWQRVACADSWHLRGVLRCPADAEPYETRMCGTRR